MGDINTTQTIEADPGLPEVFGWDSKDENGNPDLNTIGYVSPAAIKLAVFGSNETESLIEKDETEGFGVQIKEEHKNRVENWIDNARKLRRLLIVNNTISNEVATKLQNALIRNLFGSVLQIEGIEGVELSAIIETELQITNFNETELATSNNADNTIFADLLANVIKIIFDDTGNITAINHVLENAYRNVGSDSPPLILMPLMSMGVVHGTFIAMQAAAKYRQHQVRQNSNSTDPNVLKMLNSSIYMVAPSVSNNSGEIQGDTVIPGLTNIINQVIFEGSQILLTDDFGGSGNTLTRVVEHISNKSNPIDHEQIAERLSIVHHTNLSSPMQAEEGEPNFGGRRWLLIVDHPVPNRDISN